uniref:PWWP domain-containing protein n=1 Tax=Clastoptera arizonana TaxID=38151 RepID=A0A1B6D4M2_9HEMI
MSKRKYTEGDYIFAKVRGYPPWPAWIQKVDGENCNKIKYHVIFYGTNETAVCKSEDLYPYVEFRRKYGNCKSRGFVKALQEVDSELALTQNETIIQNSNIENNKVILETSCVESKRVKSPSKSKKFVSSGEKNAVLPVYKNNFIGFKRVQKGSSLPKNFLLSTDDDFKTGILLAYTPFGQKFEIQFDLKQSHLRNGMLRKSWLNEVNESVEKVKHYIETGKKVPELLKNHVVKKYNARMVPLKWNKANTLADDKKEHFLYLKTECKLLGLACELNKNLIKMDPVSCLKLLDELLELNFVPVMIKKRPQIVNILTNLRKVCDFDFTWEMSPEKVEEYTFQTKQIKVKIEHALNKIKSLFSIPFGQSLEDFISDICDEFSKHTNHMSLHEFNILMSDPTVS